VCFSIVDFYRFSSRLVSHARPCIDSREVSPATFDHYLDDRDGYNQFQRGLQHQLSSLNVETDVIMCERLHTDENIAVADDDDDDDLALGDEASAGLLENMSDDDGHVSHNFNVSPTIDDDDDDDDDDTSESAGHKRLRTPPSTSPSRLIKHRGMLDHTMIHPLNHNYDQNQFSHQSHDQSDASDQELVHETDLPSTNTQHSSDRSSLVRMNNFSFVDKQQRRLFISQ
jgi:hypothetical protein